MANKIEVGVLGATGMVGQQFINQLQGHPWFDLTWLGASERSAGKPYREAASWTLDGDIPASVADKIVQASTPGDSPRLMFSAMDASVAGPIEQAFAAAGCVIVSNSRNHRMDADVPLLIPEINADHLGLIPIQRKNRGWSGAIVTNPNCSTITMTMGLAPLKPFGITKVLAATMQAISGAGYPGTPSMDIVGNVVPYVAGEEGKMESETLKILGDFGGDGVADLPAVVSAHCNRVGVVDGHTVAVSVSLDQHPNIDELNEAFGLVSRRAAREGLTQCAEAARPRDGRGQPTATKERRAARRRHGRQRRPCARVPGARLQVRRVGPQHHPGSRRRGSSKRRAAAKQRPARLTKA